MSIAVFWIVVSLLAVAVIVLMVKVATVPMTYFNKMELSHVHAKELQIDVGDIELHACLYLPKYALNEKNEPIRRLPLIFFNTGWGLAIDKPLFKQWAVPLTLAGPYAVLAYDYRGVGKSSGPKLMTPKILDDIPKVFDYGLAMPEIDPGRVGFLGISFGAVVALTKAYADERIKAVASIVGLHNVKENFSRKPKNPKEMMILKMMHATGVKQEILSDEDNRVMSPEFNLKADRPDLNERVFLMNCLTDEVIASDSCEKNMKILHLPPEQTLITNKGGHAGARQEFIITARLYQFFHAKLG